jgi:HK97 family phage major capsid protein
MLKALLEKRDAIQAQLDTLAAAENFTDAQQTDWDKAETEITSLDNQIKRVQAAAASSHTGATATAQAAATPRVAALVAPPANTGMSNSEQRDLRSFSFVKAFSSANDPRSTLDGLEAEMHAEASKDARAAGLTIESGGIGVPQIVLESGSRRAENAHSATGGTSGSQGGLLIDTDVRPFIDILMESLQLRSLGATFLSGLQGNVKFPRAIRSTAKPVAKAENATAQELAVTFGSFDLTPHRIPAYLTVSDQLLLQSSQSVEAWLRNYLAREIALKVDDYALTGSGSGDVPEGLLNITGINIASLGTNGLALSRALAIAMQRRLKDSKARPGGWKYLMTPGIEEGLQNLLLDSGSGKFLIDESRPGMVAGLPYEYSHTLPTDTTKGSSSDCHSIVLGNWASMLIAQWGGIVLKSDPYTGVKEGLNTLVATTYMDVNVEHPEEFEVYTDVIA